MYYHITIVTTIDVSCVEQNKTDLKVIEDTILIPYLRGESFQFASYDLNSSIIKKVTIIQTTRASHDIQNNPRTDITADRIALAKLRILSIDEMEKKSGGRKPVPGGDLNSVFIVHGHDELAKLEVARFVEKLGLRTIILHDQVNSGKSIIEKIEEFSNVGFAVILYTACDVGAKQSEKDKLKPRARQNVLFEHGYLLSKLGRKSVCAIVKGEIEIPNDLSGVYLEMDGQRNWQIALAKELKHVGYKIDMNVLV